MPSPNLKDILSRARDEESLKLSELTELISLDDPFDMEELFALSRELRNRYTGTQIFTYGFVYHSTICRNDCLFCAYRKSNRHNKRYRKSLAEVLEASRSLSEQGVNLIDLTMGEDPKTDEPEYLESVAQLIFEVKRETGAPIMISPGLVGSAALRLFQEAGALWYACYQETYSPQLFKRLRVGQSFQKRLSAKIEAKRAGLLVEEGILCGVGETPQELALSVLAMKELKAAQVRAMAYVPPKENISELKGLAPDEARVRELIMIAVLRLTHPQALIPASLDVEGISGISQRLKAGANLITSFVPAGIGLQGVAQAELDIDNQMRSVASVTGLLSQMQLSLASRESYLEKVRELQ
ncbi:MAG: methylornithine synthase PylB [Deltaproteobacteria bacterium]|jgi:methylornithine synthase|nr:methylornithine synthase PylB [Deltaproteobacteria bacterium]